MGKEILRAKLLHHRLFFHNLYNKTASEKKLILHSASNIEIKLLLHVLHQLANEAIPLKDMLITI